MIRPPVSERAKAPAHSLADIPKLCDPYTPLDPVKDAALHQDLAPIRGGDRLARIIRGIRRSGGIPTLHFLTGHLGSGKTTELLGVRRQLQQRDASGDALHVLFIDADEMLDAADVELEDILVAVWRAIAEHDPGIATNVLGAVWKDQVLSALSKLTLNLPALFKDAVSQLSNLLRQAPVEERKKLRGALGSVTPALIEGLNRAFDALRDKEKEIAGSMELAVIVDNLEKINPVDRERIERLYLDRMGALKQLDAHLIITVPFYLLHSEAGASLVGLYGGDAVVLPMVKVQKPVAAGGGDYDPGIKLLADLLGRRVDFDHLFEGGTDTAKEIARRSGGCIRHALRIVAGAANECDQAPVTRDALNRATAFVQADLERALPERWIATLRHVAAKNQFPADVVEADKRDMLRHLFVLEYQNSDPDPWYAVHPLVVRCQKYQQAE